MNKIKLILITSMFLFSSHSIGQNKTEMAAYNIGFGSIFSGIGALINKKPNERWHKVLLKGMGQGALGGYLIYESKNLIGKIEQKQSLEYSWYGKLLNSAGTSIVENASSNRNFWEKWHLNIGFNRFEFYTKDRFKVKYKVMPVSFFLTAYSALKWNFELEKTMQSGEIIFSGNVLSDLNYEGFALGNVVVVDKANIRNASIFSHEFIHVYQYYDFNVFNTYLNKSLKRLSLKSNTLNDLSEYLYYDFQEAISRPIYLLENENRDCHYSNFFEYEAGFYSNTINCN